MPIACLMLLCAYADNNSKGVKAAGNTVDVDGKCFYTHLDSFALGNNE